MNDENRKRNEELFARWLEGDASAEDERALEAGAASDPALAAELAAHRALRAELRALPRALEPGRDLFAEIAQRTSRTATVAKVRPFRSRSSFATPRRLALAASLLAALALGWGLRAKVAPTPVVVEVPAPPRAISAPSVASTAYAATGRELDAIRDQLRQSVDAQSASLPPETRRLVFDNLATIDRAITEIEGALAASPADAELARTYVAYRQRQIELLRQANRLAARL